MATTTRLGLDVPQSSENVSTGPAEFSQALTILDNALLYGEGTLVAIGAASAHPAGYLYRCTDVSLIFIGDHTNWHPVPTDVGAQPIGAVTQYAGASDPTEADGASTRWMICDGRAISRSTYAALFTKLATAFGAGNGSTTFNIPDGRGRTAIGAGTGAGLTARTLGATTGEEAHVLSTAELAAHNHGLTDPGHHHTYQMLMGWSAGASTLPIWDGSTHGLFGGDSFSTATSTTGVSVNNAGGGGSHNNIQPSLVLNHIIRVA